ncbi:hypothetical protein QYE76_021862 [Lolium multiflorum]|uniref:Retrotransposon gag domain-containing protein n=1 Tax=Lolium multiflorum TaxID=4521 RepID=A0AAD8R8R5_LOLMU|nr:hypothetical protein QYE76_021862 [Lolium multiflorum]
MENEALLSDDDDYEGGLRYGPDARMRPSSTLKMRSLSHDAGPGGPEEPPFDRRPTPELATGNANNHNGGDGNGDHRSGRGDFRAPTLCFHQVPLNLSTDDWLRTIENNLEVAEWDDEKVLFATHYLAGPARAWWENVKAIQAEGHVINWEEFKTKFRKTTLSLD